MRRLLLALCLLSASALTAQVVEESLGRDPGPLDFIQGDSYEQWIFQSLAGDALVGITADGRLVPRLAVAWSTRKDGSVAFSLRTDATFTDGSPVQAADVLWTLQELLRNPQASPTKRAILAGATVGTDTSGPWIRSPKPTERLLLELARIPIARRNAPQCGSGPFSYRQEAGAWRFERRAHFLQPRIDGLRFRLMPDAASVQVALQKGWLSLGAAPSRRQTGDSLTHRLLVQPMHAQLVVWSQAGPGPLKLLERWRREAFPPRLLGQNATPSRGLWPETLGFEIRSIQTEARPPKAPSRLNLLYGAGEESVEKLLLALRERARQDGFDLQLSPLEQGLLVDRLQKGDFELACCMVVFDAHPWAVLEYLEPQGPMNFTGWRHPRLAAVTERLQRPGSPAWNELQALWAASPAALPLLDFRSVLWIDRRLQVQPSPLGLYLTTPGAAGWRWTR